MTTNDDKIVNEAVANLASIFYEQKITESFISSESDALWTACKIVAKATGIETIIRPSEVYTQRAATYLQAVANTSGFRFRKVVLKGNWWQADNGPLLVFARDNNKPFAAVVNKRYKYEIIDPTTGKTWPLTPALAANLGLQAFSFYRTFSETQLTPIGLAKFALKGQKHDLIRILLLQMFMGLLALAVPIATGKILDIAVPTANINMLWQFLCGLLVMTFSTTVFSAVQSYGLIRFRFKSNYATQAAIWDRLLKLPANFFHLYSPGDLTTRAAGIDTIQQSVTDASLHSILSGFFSIITIGLMLYYSWQLTLMGIALLIIILILMIIVVRVQIHFQRPMLALQGKLASFTLQMINGISKLRISGSEPRAFAVWAEQFAQQMRLHFQASRWGIRFGIISAFYSIFVTIILYALVGKGLTKLTFGSFIAFNAAFGQFFAAVLSFGGVFINLTQLIPLLERIKPIVTTLPEQEKTGTDPGVLSGKIEFKKVNFRYQTETPLTLENISLQINPGESVALAGLTGSGKSTIFRLLLGFDMPNSGNIFYNDIDLTKLNIRSVREQLGVVLQNAVLVAGTIFENIAGSIQITMDEAWEALKQVGLARDIAAMPMGLHTFVIEGGKTLSAGQRQRLMIARSLVRKPRILLLDEATSALDNPTQIEVIRNLQQLKITQIIAAHRLSTLVNVSHIYVLDQGKIVQAGNYESLTKEPGLFAELVQRQRFT